MAFLRKMRSIILVFLLIASRFMEQSSLSHKDFCKPIEKKSCNQEGLKNHFKFVCEEYCSKTPETCREYSQLTLLMNSNALFNALNSYNKKKLGILLTEFSNDVKLCPSPKVSKWNSDEVCTQPTRYCYKRKDFDELGEGKNKQKISKNQNFVETKCKCNGQYGFSCTKDFCTTNQNTCIKIKSENLRRSMSSSFGIKYCTSNVFISL